MFGSTQTPFGSSGGGGFGQAANSTPAFGTPAPAAFGQAPAAGGFVGSTFGAPAPAPGGFGGFGAAPAPGGFGATPAPTFGAAPAPATGFGAPSAGGFGAPASSPFGAPAPATGGLFGSAPAPATGGLFGSTPAPAPGGFGAAPAAGGFGGGAFGASSTPAFGAPAPSPGMFGSAPAPATGGLFGSTPAPAPGGFGSTMGGFGSMGTSTSTTFGAPAPATGGIFGAPAPAPSGGLFGSVGATAGAGGTKIAAFQPTTRQDGTNSITLHSISAMQQYGTKSAEELRLEDYTQGNKGTGAAQAGGFGAPAPAFGAPAPAPTGGLFGAAPAPAFGAAPAPATSFGFGTPAPATGAFGAPAPAAPAFGSPAPATGLFGAPAAPAFGAPAPGAFGAKPAGGLFGAPAPAPAAGGLFGAPAPAPATGGLFGAPAPAPAFGAAPAPAGGLFGAAAPPPATGGLFGTPAPAPAFGAAPAPAFGGFGAAPAPSTSLFGAPAPAGGLFGAAPAPSLFGAPAPAPAGGGLFGTPAAAPVAQPQVAAPYAAPPLGAVMPPAANEIMASQLAALESKRKEMEANDNFRNKPSESSSVTAISLSESDSRRNMIGHVKPARISSYRASPMSNAKLRPRGFASPPSDKTLTNLPQSLSKLGTGGKPMAAPETVAASSATRLIIAPSPKPKLKITLGGGEKKTVKIAAASSPKKLNGGLGSVQNTSDFASPQAISTPKSTTTNGLSSTPKSSDVERARQYYQQVIGSPDDASGTPGSSKKQIGAPNLSKEGYTCHPPIAVLQEMDSANLAAVSNFSVTRKGVGKVEWEGAVDVRGANLDRIVVIEPKSVSVYTDEEDEGRKPEVGTKLNRPAVLTMENVFPPDPNAPEKFVKKVARQTAKMDAELISYLPSTGEWILRVQHFSRYALDDDDSDDEDIENKQPHPELQKNSYKGKVDFSFGEREGRSPVTKEDGLKKITRQDTPYKMQGLLVLDEDDEMEEENYVTMTTNVVTTESSIIEKAETAFTQMQMSLEAEDVIKVVKKKIEKDTAIFPEESTPIGEDRDMSVHRTYIPNVQDMRTAASMPSFSFKLAEKNSISTSKSSSTDFGLRMGRSFRVGWSPDGSFFSIGKSGDLVRSRPKLEKIDVGSELTLLETHRSYVQKTKTEDNCPLLSLSSKTTFTNSVKNTLESYSSAVKSTGGAMSSLSESAYSLLQVLHESKAMKERNNKQTGVFGTVNKPADHIIENQCLSSITRWFVNSCREEVSNEVFQARAKEKKYEALLSAVSGGDLSAAAKIAEEENLFQLSILLASGPDGRKDIFEEIMAWRKSGNGRLIPDELSRTYRVIAGDLSMEEDAYKQSSKGSTTFDWRRRMVMKLMFSKPEQAWKSLPSAIAHYEADVSKGIAPFPSAHYCKDNIESTLFRLLKLGTQAHISNTEFSLSNVVDPLGYTNDPNNFSLSFHLTSCITSIYASPTLSLEEECTLLDGYAFQLQTVGLWEWAVYVFLCVLCDNTHATSTWRIQRAKSLVLQNYFEDDTHAKKRLFLENLGLPSDWFEEALCYRSLTAGDTFGYIRHNLNLDQEKAIKVLERTLVPNIFFIGKERRDSILKIFDDLSSKMEHRSLVTAVSTFFAICEDIQDLERCTQAEIKETVPDLMECCEEVQQIFSSYKLSEEKLVNNSLDIVPENYLVPLGSFLAEALHQTSHFKLQLLALKNGMGISNTASQMLTLLRSQGPSDYSSGNKENVCRWLM